MSKHETIPLKEHFSPKIKTMNTLTLIAIILIALWALGFFAFAVGGGLIHLLLVIALVIIVVRLLQGKKTDTVNA